jgi:hypothetical protein
VVWAIYRRPGGGYGRFTYQVGFGPLCRHASAQPDPRVTSDSRRGLFFCLGVVWGSLWAVFRGSRRQELRWWHIRTSAHVLPLTPAHAGRPSHAIRARKPKRACLAGWVIGARVVCFSVAVALFVNRMNCGVFKWGGAYYIRPRPWLFLLFCGAVCRVTCGVV